MEHRSVELERFVGEYVDSLLAWDVVVLLQQNRGRYFSAGEMSTLLCRPTSEIGPILVRLRNKGMISDGSPFMATRAFHEPAAEFINALGDRQERLRILGEVLAKQSGMLLSA